MEEDIILIYCMYNALPPPPPNPQQWCRVEVITVAHGVPKWRKGADKGQIKKNFANRLSSLSAPKWIPYYGVLRCDPWPIGYRARPGLIGRGFDPAPKSLFLLCQNFMKTFIISIILCGEHNVTIIFRENFWKKSKKNVKLFFPIFPKVFMEQ
jgi:hypothetical protein